VFTVCAAENDVDAVGLLKRYNAAGHFARVPGLWTVVRRVKIHVCLLLMQTCFSNWYRHARRRHFRVCA